MPQLTSSRTLVLTLVFTTGCSSFSATIVESDAGVTGGTSGTSTARTTAAGSDAGITGGTASSSTVGTTAAGGGGLAGGGGTATGSSSATGGMLSAASTHDSTHTGGTLPSTVQTGGVPSLGGYSAAGGTSSPGTGGLGTGGILVGGSPSSGGAAGGGSAASVGGASASSPAGGGTTAASGGTTAITSPGGTTSLGGTTPVSAGGGAVSQGGTDSIATSSSTGGNPSTGGISGTGGSSSDPCANQPCKNGGTCMPNGTSYTCSCIGGHFGAQCETAHFEWLGVDGATPHGISADGDVVVGAVPGLDHNSLPARWTKATGFVALASSSDVINYGFAQATNADGSIIVGQVSMLSGGGAFRWNATEGVVLLDAGAGSSAQGVNLTGTAIVGTMHEAETSRPHAFRWTRGTGLVDLAVLGSGGSVAGISGDGTVIVGGYAPVNATTVVPFRWTQNQGIVQLGSDSGGQADAISADGSTIVGRVNGAFRYASDVGFAYMDLGKLTTTYALALSGDGSVIVGSSDQGGWIWDAASGVRLVADVLTNLNVDLGRWTISACTAVSSDGKTLVGVGFRDAVSTSWIARL